VTVPPISARWMGDAPAKVNLRLDVLERDETGYHQIETVFQAVELSDRLVVIVEEGDGVALELSGVPNGALGPSEQNLAVQAADAFRVALIAGGRSCPGIRIALEKVIPHGAGLGGGSSDAAAVLLGLNQLFDQPLSDAELARLGADLGSDVPFFVCGVARAMGWGRGDRIVPLDPLPARDVLLVVPSAPIATERAYRVLAEQRVGMEVSARAGSGARAGSAGSWADAASGAHNDFEVALFPLRPELAAIKTTLTGAGARLALLCGSGSAVFGVFDDEQAVARADAEVAGLGVDARTLRTRTR